MPDKHALASQILTDAGKGAVLGSAAALGAGALGLPDVLHRSPLELLPLLALFGAVMYLTPARIAMWIAAGLPAVLIAVIAFTPVIDGPVRSLVRSDSIGALPDVIVVLSSGVTDDGRVNAQGVDRLLTGLELASRLRGAGPAMPIVITTVRGNERDRTSPTSTSDQRAIIALARDSTAIHETPLVLSTRDEALHTKRIAERQRWDHVAVVTSVTHTRRACATFERVGLRVTCVSARSSDISVARLRSPGQRLHAFRAWLYETVGILNYRWHGWL